MTNRTHRFTRAELDSLPTLAVGKADGIEYRLVSEWAGQRIWTDGVQVVVETATGDPARPWREVEWH